MDGAFLDHAASSPLRPVALEAMVGCAGLSNPASLHRKGRLARASLEDAREKIANLFGAKPDEVIFTSGGSESDTIAVLGASAMQETSRPELVISPIEHQAVEKSSEVLGARLRKARVNSEGVVDLESLQLNEKTGLVSVMWANNEVGSIQPIDQIVASAKEAGSLVHCDAVQAAGHFPIDFDKSGIDLLSISAHKMGGPVGIGALIIKRGLNLPPWGLGGRQEGGIRSGTQPVALANGFAAAASEAVNAIDGEFERISNLRDQIIEKVNSTPGTRDNGDGSNPYVINIGVDGASADDLLFLFDQRGICISTGSACRAGVHGPSEVLLAMGQNAQEASQAIRLSMGWSTTEEEVRFFVAAFREVVETARSVQW